MQSLPLAPARPLLLLALLCCSCGKGGSVANWLTGPSYDTHARYLPLSGTVHANIDCATCHTADTFSVFDCLSCHTKTKTDPFHAAVTGYQWTSAGCYGCHPQGEGKGMPANHDTAFFPRGTGTKHSAVGCSQCHTDLANAGNAANFACATCHAGLAGFPTAHAAVVGVDGSTVSAQCLTCHGDGQVSRVAAHGPFVIAKGSSTHDTVCLQCHTTLRTDKPFAADFTAYACTACHTQPDTDPKHAGVTGYQYASASCYGCHPTGSGQGLPADHDTAFFPRGTGSKHATIAVCSDCHTDLAHANDPTQFACGSCHLSRDAALVAKHTSPGSSALVVRASEIDTGNSATCLKCHADSQLVTSHPSGGDGFPPHQGAHCLWCHDGARTDKAFGIDFASNPADAAKLAGRHGCYTSGCHNSAPPQGN